MKRLILIGGMPWKADATDNALSRTLRNFPTTEIKVAFCAFARTPTKWDEDEQESIDMFNRFGSDKKLTYRSMTSENFQEVSEWADVIYLPGGDTYALMSETKKHSDIAKWWDGKTVVGSSAGADVLCAHFVYLQDKSLGDGLGWLQMSCIPHWQQYTGYEAKDWDDIETETLKRFPDLPVLCIPEGHFVEITVR